MLCNRIKQFREYNNIETKNLAEVLGISEELYKDFELRFDKLTKKEKRNKKIKNLEILKAEVMPGIQAYAQLLHAFCSLKERLDGLFGTRGVHVSVWAGI